MPRVHRDRVRRAAARRELALEGHHLGPERVGAAVEHAPEGGLELAPERVVLGPQVDEGNHGAVSTGEISRGPGRSFQGDRVVAAAGLEPATRGL